MADRIMRYYYRDKNTMRIVEIERRVADRDIPPTLEEALSFNLEKEDILKAEWERLLSPFKHVGPKGKGNW